MRSEDTEAEIKVLKEMNKSLKMQLKSKDTDV